MDVACVRSLCEFRPGNLALGTGRFSHSGRSLGVCSLGHFILQLLLLTSKLLVGNLAQLDLRVLNRSSSIRLRLLFQLRPLLAQSQFLVCRRIGRRLAKC